MSSYRAKRMTPTNFRVTHKRGKVGSIWMRPNSDDWTAKLTVRGDVFETTGHDDWREAFDAVVTFANRVALGVDRHDADGARAVLAERNERRAAEVAAMNAEFEAAGLPIRVRITREKILA